MLLVPPTHCFFSLLSHSVNLGLMSRISRSILVLYHCICHILRRRARLPLPHLSHSNQRLYSASLYLHLSIHPWLIFTVRMTFYSWKVDLSVISDGQTMWGSHSCWSTSNIIWHFCTAVSCYLLPIVYTHTNISAIKLTLADIVQQPAWFIGLGLQMQLHTVISVSDQQTSTMLL